MTLKTDIDQLVADAALVHSWANGDANTTVTINGVLVRSPAKLIGDFSTWLSSNIQTLGAVNTAAVNFTGGSITGLQTLGVYGTFSMGAVNLGPDTGRLGVNGARVLGTYTFMPPGSVVNSEVMRFYNANDPTGTNLGSFSLGWNSSTQMQLASFTYGTGVPATSLALLPRILFGTTTDDGVSAAQGVSASFGTIKAGTPSATTMGPNTTLRSGVSGGASIGGISAAVTTAVDTGIPVNQGMSGGTLVFVGSRNTGTGVTTESAVYIVHFFYDGNNTPIVTYLGGSSNFLTFAVSASNTLTVTNAGGGNAAYSWFGNK